MTESAIYAGSVVHTRLRPVRHRLRYRMMWLLLDLDEVAALGRRLRLFSFNRFNLFDFRERDHGSGEAEALKPQIERHLRQAGLEPDGGPIRLLCMPRVLGFVFNPLSVYYCHRRDGTLLAALYEVNNTFGQRHSYLVPLDRGAGPVAHRTCTKQFHVSPFMDMDMTYHLRIVAPGPRASVAIESHDAAGLMMSAAFTGRRRDLTDGNLLRAFLRHPMLAAQVVGGILWEALKLWRKGVAVRALPPAPPRPISIAVAQDRP